MTPLNLACLYGHGHIAEMLIDEGAKIDRVYIFLIIKKCNTYSIFIVTAYSRITVLPQPYNLHASPINLQL